MPTWGWIPIGIAIAVVLLAALWAILRTSGSRSLKRRFGPEYDRTVASHGDRRVAEDELRRREDERARLDIRPLPERSREEYLGEWEDVQAQFVDEPAGAVADADRLVARVMRERGYPVEDFASRAALVSVDHPDVVANYREGHALFESFESGDGTTEDLRRAMRHYRALFDELLEERPRRRLHEPREVA